MEMLLGTFGHFGEVWKAAGGPNLHLSEQRGAAEMKCLEKAGVLCPLTRGSEVSTAK